MNHRRRHRSAQVQNVREIATLEAEHLQQRPWAERVAGLVTRAAGPSPSQWRTSSGLRDGFC